jgi:DNA-binding response OmpR family regulator
MGKSTLPKAANQLYLQTKKKILAIDDELSIRLLLENFLSKTYDVITKADGMEALKWMEEGNLPDLVVADIQMPNVDGYEFIKNLRSSGFFKDIPLIMLSGIESSQEKVKCLKLGANDYMVKPFNPEELSVRIELLLSRK